MRSTLYRCLWIVPLLGLSLPLTLAFEPSVEKGISEFPKLSAATDWPWWRGPLRNGDATSAGVVPTAFKPEDATWKVPVPGRGHSSPIVVGQRIFLTTADEKAQVQSVLAFDRQSGKQLWKKDISQGGFPKRNHSKNTEATATIACDGERLFVVFFHHEGLHTTALDLDGNEQWRIKAGAFNPQRYEYGYGTSPIIYRNTVIVTGEYDGASFIAAFDRKTGKEVWRTPRTNSISFSTPTVGHVAGKDQILISGQEQVSSYDPATGKQLWSTAGTTHATCGTMVWSGDIVFASGGYPKAETIAVKADGSREVLWKNNQKCYEQSMITVDGYLYGLTDNGILFCWEGKSGKEMWKQRLRGPVSASPVLAGGNLYQANELGTLYVWKPNPEKFEMVAENQIGNDSFPSPAVAGGQIFLRVADSSGGKRQEFLYCFGKQR